MDAHFDRPGMRLYATTPGRALLQALGDFMVIMWLVLCYTVGHLVFTALTAVAAAGQQVRGGADGISGNLSSAGSKVDGVPLVGNQLKAPLIAAGSAAHQIAQAGQGLDDKASLLAIVLSLAVAIPPALMAGVPWLVFRLRFVRRTASTATLATGPGGEQLLALRALANRPLTRVIAAVPGKDPLEAWRAGDADATRRLALLELRRAGLGVPRQWKASLEAT